MRMEFDINKCAMLIMKRGRLTHSEGITLPDNLQIREMKEDDDGYKYLGVLEVEGIKHPRNERAGKKRVLPQGEENPQV